MSYKVEIPKLTEDNFPLWKMSIQNEFCAADLVAFVSQDVKPSQVDPKDVKCYWQMASIITSSISKDLSHLVVTESDDPEKGYPFLLWKKIENHFTPLNAASKHRLKVEFFHLALEEGEETSRFITRINECAMKVNMVLTALKKKEGFVCDDDKLSVLLFGIEKVFPIDHAVLSKDSRIVYDAACAYVIQNCKNDKEKSDSSDKLRFVGESSNGKPSKNWQKRHGGGNGGNGGGSNSNGGKKGKKPLKCFNCGGMGHKAADCSAKKSNGRAEGKKETILAAYDELFALERSEPGNYVMIDTGCTRHICGRGTRNLLKNV